MNRRERLNRREKLSGRLYFDNPSNKEGMADEPSVAGTLQGFNSLIKQAQEISNNVESLESINKRASHLYPGRKYYGMYSGEQMMEGDKKVLRKYIRNIISESFNGDDVLINTILDKINQNGIHSLSYDEKNYLNQYNNNDVDENLKQWLLSDDDYTFNDETREKLLYDEFDGDENIFYNQKKLIRIISKHLNKKPFTSNADWGGAYVWAINSKNNYEGLFLYLGDDELLLINRTVNKNEDYEDEVLKNIENSQDLYKTFLKIKKT
jgi:hypothetical protein